MRTTFWIALLALSLRAALASAAPKDDLAAAVELSQREPEKARVELEKLAALPRTDTESKDAAARASFHLGELAEARRDYSAALGRYRDVLAIDPGNWFAGAARARVDTLAPYEGAFAELAKLDAVRKDPAKANDRAAIEALANELSSFSSPRVRREAAMFVAEAFVGRLRDPEHAIAPALSVAHDVAADAYVRAAAWELAYAALERIGDVDRARTLVADASDAPPALRARVRRDVRRLKVHRVAVAVAGAGLIAALAATVVAMRRGRARRLFDALTRPSAIVFVVLTAALGAWLSDAWESGFGKHFWWLGVALAAVHLLVAALRGALGDRARGVRVAAGLFAAACVLAGAWLVLEHAQTTGTPLLDGFGL